MSPKVTVYITNYNYARYLRGAIASVLGQTLQDFELLIIDDGSTDASRDIMEEYASDERVKLVYQQNRGLNVTNNIALRLARGDYVVRLDADDWFEPEALEVMAGLLDADPALGLVFPDYVVVDGAGAVLETVQRLDFAREVTLLDQPAHGACTMLRRDFLVALGGYDESYTCQDGYELWIKFTARHGVLNVRRPLFHYRRHGANLTENENRILDTRMAIKRDYVSRHELARPKTLAVIPVRDTRLAGEKLAHTSVGGRSLLQRKIDALLGAETVAAIVVASEDLEVRDHMFDLFPADSRPHFVQRSARSARFNESLVPTLQEVLGAEPLARGEWAAVLTGALEYPFVTADVFDDAVNTLTIFKCDSLVSVRPDHSSLYQHHGAGMVPILGQDRFTKLEREALYRAVGGVMLTRIDGMEASGKILHGLVGHVVIDKRAALEVATPFDLSLANFIDRAASGATGGDGHD
jgi:CMP-N-acetylneuraminic acid synthetase